MRVASIALALCASAPAFAASDQFDLVCTGKVTIRWNLETRARISRYHVDLAAKQWCVDDCPAIKGFAEVSPTILVFDEAKAAFRGDPSERLDFVKRDTGYWAFSDSTWQGEGSCEPAPFSGFPTIQSKF
jgi:hypothetical protein